MTEQELIITTAKDMLVKLLDRYEPVGIQADDAVLEDLGRRLTLLAKQVKGTLAEISGPK